MSLTEKVFLLVSDSAEVREHVEKVLKPIVKTLVTAESDLVAINKISNQSFDVILYRSTKPGLEDPTKVFQWSKASKRYQKIPWIVLGTDIETQEQIAKFANLKFIENYKDGAALIKMLDGVFYSPGAAGKIDVTFINPFVSAVNAAFESMAQVKFVRGNLSIRKPGDAMVEKNEDVFGVIAMNSDRFLGSVSLRFQEKLILEVFSKMKGSPTTSVNEAVKGAVAEMTNVIFGTAKKELNAAGHSIESAEPSVVTGKNSDALHSVDGVCIVIPFNSDYGMLTLECVVRANA